MKPPTPSPINDPDDIRAREGEWIQNVLNGRIPDFEKLVKRYQKLVFSQIFQMLRNPELAEEMSQEVFLAAFNSLKTFIPGSSFKSWILKIAYNRCLDHFRKAKIRFDPNFDMKNLAIPGDLEEATANRDLLGKLLERINLESQILLHMKYILDLSYEEMAFLMEDTPGNIKIKIHRIKKLLQEKVGLG